MGKVGEKTVIGLIGILLSRVSHVEEQAVRNLIEKFSANKSRLMKEFLLKDPEKTGEFETNEPLCDKRESRAPAKVNQWLILHKRSSSVKRRD